MTVKRVLSCPQTKFFVLLLRLRGQFRINLALDLDAKPTKCLSLRKQVAAPLAEFFHRLTVVILRAVQALPD